MVKIEAIFISIDVVEKIRYDIPLEDYDITNMRIGMLIEDMEEFFTL